MPSDIELLLYSFIRSGVAACVPIGQLYTIKVQICKYLKALILNVLLHACHTCYQMMNNDTTVWVMPASICYLISVCLTTGPDHLAL